MYVGLMSFVPLALLQLLPARYTTTKGTQASIITWRSNIWSLPYHMLSSLGKGFRITTFLLWTLTAIFILVSVIICVE